MLCVLWCCVHADILFCVRLCVLCVTYEVHVFVCVCEACVEACVMYDINYVSYYVIHLTLPPSSIGIFGGVCE